MLVPAWEGCTTGCRGSTFAAPELGPNAFRAADRCTCNSGFTAFSNTFESSNGNRAFCCAIALSVFNNSLVAEMAQAVVEVVGVVCVVVKLTIGEPAGVATVRAEVIWVGFKSVSLAVPSSHSVFRIVTSLHRTKRLCSRPPHYSDFSRNLPRWQKCFSYFPTPLACHSCLQSLFQHWKLRRTGLRLPAHLAPK